MLHNPVQKTANVKKPEKAPTTDFHLWRKSARTEEIEVQEERTVYNNNYNNNNMRKRQLTPRRRVMEAPMLEQISEEEEESDSDSEVDFENRINSNSPRRSSLKEMSSRGGRSF